MAFLREFLSGVSSGIIYAASIFAVLSIILVTNFTNERPFFYRMASKLIGHEPESGDGAFQFPIGWLLMLGTSIILGALTAFILTKIRG